MERQEGPGGSRLASELRMHATQLSTGAMACASLWWRLPLTAPSPVGSLSNQFPRTHLLPEAHLYPVVAAQRRRRALGLRRVVQRVPDQHQLLQRGEGRQHLQGLVVGNLVVRHVEDAQLAALLEARELRDLVVAQPELLVVWWRGEGSSVMRERGGFRRLRRFRVEIP